VSCRWTETERFRRRKLGIVNDESRWDALFRVIEDDLMAHPTRYPLLPSTNWHMLKTRAGAAGLPGLILYFSMEDPSVCLFEDIDLSDEQDPFVLLDIISAGTSLYGWAQENGHAQY
jgi:hypothetical protein